MLVINRLRLLLLSLSVLSVSAKLPILVAPRWAKLTVMARVTDKGEIEKIDKSDVEICLLKKG